MAKKQLTPEEYKINSEKKAIKAEKFSKTFLSAVAVLLAVVITFSVVTTAQTFVENAKKTVVAANPDVQQNVNGDSVNSDNLSTVDDETISNIGGADEPTDSVITDTPTDNTETPEEDKKQEGAFASTEEMVAYFNECANKAKTDATKIQFVSIDNIWYW